MTAFEELGVIPELGEAVSKIGWEFPTSIQCEAIPCILGGGDVLIAAETGSGKTGAFCLPVVQIVWENRKGSESSKPNSKPLIRPGWKLNIGDRDAGLGLKQGELECSSENGQWCGARCMVGVHTRGKYYYEAKIVKDGLCRMGWATLVGSLNIGTDGESYGFGGTGMKSHRKKFDKYGESFTTGDIIGCFIDLDNKKIWWSKNGNPFEVAYSIPQQLVTSGLFPAVVLKNSGLRLNFGDTPFAHPPNNNFVAVCQADDAHVKFVEEQKTQKLDPLAPLCIVLEPTKEMVDQTHENLSHFSKQLRDPSIRCVALSRGAVDKANLEQGCDIITGSIQRVYDYAYNKVISLNSLQFVIIDEADSLLADAGGAGRMLSQFLEMLPLTACDGTRRQIIACSATLHNMNIKSFANRFMTFPQWIDLKGMDTVSENVHHVVCYVDPVEDKQWIRLRPESNRLEDDGIHQADRIMPGTKDQNTLSLGTKILKGAYVLKAIQTLNMDQCIIFCRTKQQCDHMETFLQKHGIKAACLHGDRSPEERKANLDKFRKKEIPYIICTDVMARGVDVHGVPYVINVTLPSEKELYVHRIGRVGRAERMGLAISLVSNYEEKVWFHKCRRPNCNNTADISKRGCSIWFNEKQMLADVEEHIGQSVAHVDQFFHIPVNEFDGKIVYGAKRGKGEVFEGHAKTLALSVQQLADLERSLQTSYLSSVSTHFKKMQVL
ncbi:unnamed protein product [Auanema sp. JU1783]|nr:unnamed protein product [Auanema sp. JU1783]